MKAVNFQGVHASLTNDPIIITFIVAVLQVMDCLSSVSLNCIA